MNTKLVRHGEEESEIFYYFSTEERDKIEKKIEELGYGWDKNTVCGNCCGMYAEYYYVPSIGGRFKKEDSKKMYEFLKKNNIESSIGDYTISADPNEYDEYQVK